MDYLRALYGLIPLIIAVILHTYKDAFLAVIRAKTITDFENPRQLVISVLSSRANFEKRQAIRDTWWGHLQENYPSSKLELKFVIGESCLIPPEFRRDEYSCSEWNTTLPDYYEDIPLFVHYSETHSNAHGIKHSTFGKSKFSFMVHHSVIVSKLGVHESCIGQSPISVRLVDALSETEVVSATFTTDSPGVLIEGYRYKPVESYVLSRGYEGIICVVKAGEGCSSPLDNGPTITGVSQLNASAGGIIELYDDNQITEGHYLNDPFKTGLITLASFLYHIHDVRGAGLRVADKDNQTSDWQVKMLQEEEMLRTEAAQYNDLLFVPTVDVYRNVTEKLVQAILHFSTASFYYFLKTDDDTFIDVESVLQLSEVKEHRTWQGRFRHNWAVERFGKWAERSYLSLTYPPFACGSAYMLSSDLVKWISDNAGILSRFQGEDVSLGIWLSGLDVYRADSPLWGCGGECAPGLFSLPQLTPSQLRQFWHNWRTCRNLCKCSMPYLG